jgi:hypothetical protein
VYIDPATHRKKSIRTQLPGAIFPSMAESTERGSSDTMSRPQLAPLWLSELNRWRRMAGLRVVVENTHLSDGSEKHARYLVVQGPANTEAFRDYDRSIGTAAHVENPKSPSYTAGGAQAAIGGPLAADVIQGADVAWEGRTESGDIDNLILAPFHRLSLLAPWAQTGGYGSFGEYPRRAAALVLRGPLDAEQEAAPTEFPPRNTTISLNSLAGSEWPNPIASCVGYRRPVGLPITLQTNHQFLLQSYSLYDQTSSETLEACGFDASSYHNSDATQQKRGCELLDAYGAAILIPRVPLSFGHEYRVTMRTSRGRFEWSFRLKDAGEVETAQAQRTATRQVAATR